MNEYNADTWVVYIIKVNEYCKIGFARDFENRMKAIQTGNPDPIRKAHLILLQSRRLAQKCEHSLHNLFSNKRYHGEWFQLNEVDIAFCQTIIGYHRESFVYGKYDDSHEVNSILIKSKSYDGTTINFTTDEIRGFLNKCWERQMNGLNVFSRRYWMKNSRPRMRREKYKILIDTLDEYELIINRSRGRSGELALPPQEALKKIGNGLMKG